MFRKPNLRREADRREVSIAVVREYQSEVAALRERPYPRAAGLTIQTLCACLAIGVVFMWLSRIDRVVSSQSGAIVTSQPAVVYQALDPSIIRSLDVKEGARVGKGQILATLDPTFAEAAVSQFRAQIEGFRAQILRDQALVALSLLEYPEASNDQVARYQKENLEYYNRQMAQYQANMNSFDQKVATLQATIDKYKVEETRYATETDLNRKIESMRVTLEQHGTGSMLNLLTATQAKVESQRYGDFARNSRIEAEHSLASAQADEESYREQFKASASQDLLTARNGLEAAAPQLDAALKRQDAVRWTAPEDCVVLTVAPNMSVGSVVSQGTTVITLMPVRNPVEALVQISANDIGFVRPGDPVVLKINAFPSMEFGTLEGAVKWVGDNAYSSLSGQPVPPYYNAQVTIDRNKLINVPPTATLLPGMTLVADVKVGTRSIWDYVMGGLTGNVGQSMREP